MAEGDKDLPQGWKKLQILSGVAASLLIPLAVAIFGNAVGRSLKSEELNVKYVEMAVHILAEQPRKETSHLRQWAIDVVNRYSEVKMTEDAASELKDEALPVLNTPMVGSKLQAELEELSPNNFVVSFWSTVRVRIISVEVSGAVASGVLRQGIALTPGVKLREVFSRQNNKEASISIGTDQGAMTFIIPPASN